MKKIAKRKILSNFFKSSSCHAAISFTIMETFFCNLWLTIAHCWKFQIVCPSFCPSGSAPPSLILNRRTETALLIKILSRKQLDYATVFDFSHLKLPFYTLYDTYERNKKKMQKEINISFLVLWQFTTSFQEYIFQRDKNRLNCILCSLSPPAAECPFRRKWLKILECQFHKRESR